MRGIKSPERKFETTRYWTYKLQVMSYQAGYWPLKQEGHYGPGSLNWIFQRIIANLCGQFQRRILKKGHPSPWTFSEIIQNQNSHFREEDFFKNFHMSNYCKKPPFTRTMFIDGSKFHKHFLKRVTQGTFLRNYFKIWTAVPEKKQAKSLLKKIISSRADNSWPRRSWHFKIASCKPSIYNYIFQYTPENICYVEI